LQHQGKVYSCSARGPWPEQEMTKTKKISRMMKERRR
jgi:hypothetical protein